MYITSPKKFAALFNEKYVGANRKITAEDVICMTVCKIICRHGYYLRDDLEIVRGVLEYEQMRGKSPQALALFLLMGVTSFYMLIVLGIVYGFGFGGSNTIRLSMIAEIFGTRSTGEILGLISIAWAAGGIAGPILAGYIFDLSQSYDIAFLSSGLLLAVGAVSGFFLKAPDG